MELIIPAYNVQHLYNLTAALMAKLNLKDRFQNTQTSFSIDATFNLFSQLSALRKHAHKFLRSSLLHVSLL